jgi:putative transposase
MRRIDVLHLEHPFMGARMLRDQLNRDGVVVGHKHVGTLMKRMAAKVAITLEACHAVDVLQEAFNHHGTPEIVNTDQGSQFTAHDFVQAVKDRGCKVSMDGRGAWRDNVFVERLWKSVKYERVYLHAYDSVTEAKKSIMQYMDWYNRSRPHSSLGKNIPDEAYTVMLPMVKLVA